MDRGSNSRAQLMPVLSRESWFSLPAPLALLDDSSPAAVMESPGLLWIPSIRCQIVFILISPRTASCVHWARSHRPQVENDHNEQPQAESPRGCFLLRTLKKKARNYPALQDNVCYEKSWVARTQRFQKTDQKSYNRESHNSCCRAPTITQPPCTVPLW